MHSPSLKHRPLGRNAKSEAQTALHRGAFTLVELLVVVSIIGILVSLLLPAVQSARESSRRASCANNLRNQALALQSFHDAQHWLPPGRKWENGHETSWYLDILPQLEQNALQQAYDRQRPWSDTASNLAVANTVLSVLRCPSSLESFPGDTDYGGMTGSMLTARDWSEAFFNGAMIEVLGPRARKLNFASITDGLSQTICIAESSDRQPEEGGRWVSGYNCFSHDNGEISLTNHGGEIFSYHRTGANAAFADGSVHYLVRDSDPYVIGAFCTRDLGEIVALPGN